ncbi:MAG: molybdopterin-dependent oxidoreductase, partial [Verrucomicrobiales bacterium]
MSEANDNLVNVQIDGVWHKFPVGTRMIEACRQAEAEVPHYCYHPKLTSPGNCRMCLVEMGMPPRLAPDQEPELDEDGHASIQWIPRPAISCANTVAEGMGIRTQSELTKQCRQGVMEFLLINHPLDCPICDQAGECSLQEYSVEHGQGGSRFREEKVTKPKNVSIGSRIRLDDERCIMCSRCVRFCQEIAQDDVLGFTDRGSQTLLGVHPGKTLDNNYSLNTVDICPVGALTSEDFRFQMRVWFLKETKSIDVSCGTGCNIVIHSRENKITRITPRQNDEVNSTWMPDSHRFSFHHLQSDARLTGPLVKKGHKHETATWPEAIEAAVAKLKEAGGDKTALVASGRLSNEELFMARRFANAFGIKKIAILARSGEADDFLVSADRNPNTNGARLILGKDVDCRFPAIAEDIKKGKIEALVVLEEDLLEEGNLPAADLKKLKALVGAYLLGNKTASAADVVLPFTGACEKR